MTDSPKSTFTKLSEQYQPLESALKIKEGSHTLLIGVPKEVSPNENRVPLKPKSVELLVSNGHEVMIESGAGDGARFTDNMYSEAGAKIVYDTKEIYKAELVIKLGPPSVYEIDLMKSGITLISAFQFGNQSIDYIKALNDKKITAVGYEFIEDKVGGLPIVRAMSEIAGSSVMLIASEYLSNSHGGKGMMLGGITGVPPSKVVILGAGTVAEHAARAAMGLGVDIRVFDNHLYKLRRVKHAIGQQIHTSTIDPATLIKELKGADVFIGALRPDRGRNRFVITEEMVTQMKPGSVIIDVSIDSGGCVETSEVTTHSNPVFKKYDVIHYCVPNIASRVARTASLAFSNIMTPILLQMGDCAGINEMMFAHPWFMKGIYTYKGSLTNMNLARKYKLRYKDLSLLLAARF